MSTEDYIRQLVPDAASRMASYRAERASVCFLIVLLGTLLGVVVAAWLFL